MSIWFPLWNCFGPWCPTHDVVLVYHNEQFIIESVHIICRDRADIQCMILQNLKKKDGKCTSIYNDVPFIFECFHTQWHKKHCESTEPESHQVAKIFFFLSSSSSLNGLVQNCMTLSWWFSHKNSRILRWAVHQPITLSHYRYLGGVAYWTVLSYLLFLLLLMCMYPYSACSISTGSGGIATVAVSGQQQIINLCWYTCRMDKNFG